MHSITDRELVELFADRLPDLAPELFRLTLRHTGNRRSGPDPFASAVAEVEAFRARADAKNFHFLKENDKRATDSSAREIVK